MKAWHLLFAFGSALAAFVIYIVGDDAKSFTQIADSIDCLPEGAPPAGYKIWTDGSKFTWGLPSQLQQPLWKANRATACDAAQEAWYFLERERARSYRAKAEKPVQEKIQLTLLTGNLCDPKEQSK